MRTFLMNVRPTLAIIELAPSSTLNNVHLINPHNVDDDAVCGAPKIFTHIMCNMQGCKVWGFAAASAVGRHRSRECLITRNMR